MNPRLIKSLQLLREKILLRSGISANRADSAISGTVVEETLAAMEETQRERTDTDAALRTLPQIAPPSDLQLRLRLAVSHEQVRAGRRWSGRLSYRWHLLRENTLRPLAVHGAVASAAVLLLLGGMATLGASAPQTAVEANDIPLIGFSRPHLLSGMGPLHSASSGDAALMVEAKVNAEGRVYDYRVLSGTLDNAAAADDLREHLLRSVFTPARVFGEPVRGTVVLTFANINVKG